MQNNRGQVGIPGGNEGILHGGVESVGTASRSARPIAPGKASHILSTTMGGLVIIESSAWLGFATASLAVAIAPGPSWVYVISSTVGERRTAGFVAVAGNATGIACHSLAAALGLSAVLRLSTTAFTLARWAGALYLIYLAVRTVMQTTTRAPGEKGPRRSLRQVFRDGLLVNLLNPKVPVLMLALMRYVNPPNIQDNAIS